jgi:hypothetical protein
MATGHYYQSLQKWTLDRDDAFDFGIVSKAMRIARKLRIPELELVVSFDDPDQAATTPFQKLLLGLSHGTKQNGSVRRPSRSAVPA